MSISLDISKQALLELIKIGIGTSDGKFDFSSLSDDDWKSVMDESCAQSVHLLCFDAAKNYIDLMPGEVYSNWMHFATKTLFNNLKIIKDQKELTTLLEKNNIPYIILKGASSAYYYPDSEKRTYGDIDFLTCAEDYKRTARLLESEGFIDDKRHHQVHLAFKKPTHTQLELHREIVGIPGDRQGDVVRDYLKNVVKENAVNDDTIFYRPTDDIHGFIILLHTIHHIISGGIGFRHICDWAVFANKTHNQYFWQDKLLPVFKKAGVLKFAFILTEACVKYLGITRPLWLKNVDQELVDEFLSEIFRGGNFGRKDAEGGSSFMLSNEFKKLTLRGKLANMLKTLNKTNKQVFPILNKAPWLYPFIMAWRVLRYTVLVLLGKRKSLIKVSRYTDDRNTLFTKLGFYNIEESKIYE